ncbi:hypothetical protein RhiirA4_445895 [Rhizophagus irregularis]|uniref:Uncharacterized protein n=1 Tax=Rhizophagus irregularis TaxID=588596 RepID=A0A2I1GSC8_9GLOM|nr:hypothetical protein RhiirA4_445895 [Rhizophagus irregularis]
MPELQGGSTYLNVEYVQNIEKRMLERLDSDDNDNFDKDINKNSDISRKRKHDVNDDYTDNWISNRKLKTDNDEKEGLFDEELILILLNPIKLIQVALNNLENILKVGEIDKADGINQFVLFVEEAGGMEKIHNLQNHENLEIYKKAYHIIDKYFAEDEEEDPNLAPEMNATTGQFAFQTDVNMPQGGFHFGDNSNPM